MLIQHACISYEILKFSHFILKQICQERSENKKLFTCFFSSSSADLCITIELLQLKLRVGNTVVNSSSCKYYLLYTLQNGVKIISIAFYCQFVGSFASGY